VKHYLMPAPVIIVLIFSICLTVITAHPAAAAPEKTTVSDTQDPVKKKKKSKKEQIKKILPKYQQAEKNEKRKEEVSGTRNDADVSSIKKSASSELKNILVLLAEIPQGEENPIIAPIYMTDQKKIFGTRTDFCFNWVGYKLTFTFRQNRFPWKNTSLEEVIIGSFLYASGTNLGFIKNTYREEKRFYTNYTSQILIFRWKIHRYLTAGIGCGSRQYFFKRRELPAGFIMPRDHINIFPRAIVAIGELTEKGIDQLTEGVRLSSWAGYGIRNRWDAWGSSSDLQSGAYAKEFLIYSVSLNAGVLFRRHHNLKARARYKGGIDNDFLSRPRFGGTIDNAKLDVVHGYTLDQFRVYRFGLINTQYGFNIFKRLRLNLFFDYAAIFSPEKEGIIGTGYGIRIIAVGGLPIWLTHGIGRRVVPVLDDPQQTFMIMTAAGW